MTQCDEAQPSCSQCRRGGRKCPGYQSHLKFVDENAKLRGKAGRKAPQPSTKGATGSSIVLIKEEASPHPSSFLAECSDVVSQPSSFISGTIQGSRLGPNTGSLEIAKLNGLRPSLRSLEREGVVASFIQDLFPLGRSTVQHSFIGSWLWHVPEVLHKNNAMDLAAECVALAYFAKQAGSTEALIRSHNTYGNALRNLSNALRDRKLYASSETLCATLLLVHFEVIKPLRPRRARS
jgi:hypothetical protein